MPRGSILSLLAVGALAVIGCGGGQDDGTATTATTSTAATSIATPPPATTAATTARPARAGPKPRTVRFKALDGRRIQGVLRPAAAAGRAPAVVLLHQSDGGADQWDDFAPVLQCAGYTTLAVEGDGGLIIPDLGREARGALRWLRSRPDIDRGRVSVLGASVGADTAIWASATAPAGSVHRTVSLSPSAELTLLDRDEAGRRRARDVLIVSNAAEAGGAKLVEEVTEDSRRLEEPEGGHGVELLSSPRTVTAIMGWLAA